MRAPSAQNPPFGSSSSACHAQQVRRSQREVRECTATRESRSFALRARSFAAVTQGLGSGLHSGAATRLEQARKGAASNPAAKQAAYPRKYFSAGAFAPMM